MHSLWAIVSNGLTLRILRDNPSLTRPAYIEVDLEALFTEELLRRLHAPSGCWPTPAALPAAGQTMHHRADCPWERWRGAGQEAGVTRPRQAALPAWPRRCARWAPASFAPRQRRPARSPASRQTAATTAQAFFEELLRLVYRFIFLATVEDRRDRATGAAPGLRARHAGASPPALPGGLLADLAARARRAPQPARPPRRPVAGADHHLRRPGRRRSRAWACPRWAACSTPTSARTWTPRSSRTASC